MSSQSDYFDGNAAAGALSRVFATDITAAKGQCNNCGATRRFAEAHLYMKGPGVVARCCVCERVLLRLVTVGQRVFLDVGGWAYLRLDTTE